MRKAKKIRDRDAIESFRASLMVLLFGVASLGYLVAIDRTEWFHIRPVSGAAIAMANTATKAPSDNAQP